MLEAVKLQQVSMTGTSSGMSDAELDKEYAEAREREKHTSQHELAIWQPAWPTVQR
jgi:uncharacterized protein YecT (DUF1311 family)